MGIDVSICVSPQWFSHTTYIFYLSLLIFPVNCSIISPGTSLFIASPPSAPCLSLLSLPPPSSKSLSIPLPLPQLSSALMFDAVHVVVGAVRELNRSQEIGVKPLSCTSPQIWQHGTSLMNYLRMVNTWSVFTSQWQLCAHIHLVQSIVASNLCTTNPHSLFLVL